MFHSVDVNQFVKVVPIINDREDAIDEALSSFLFSCIDPAEKFIQFRDELIEVNSNIMKEMRATTKKNPFRTASEMQQDANALAPMMDGSSFFRVSLSVVGTFADIYEYIFKIAQGLRRRTILTSLDATSMISSDRDYFRENSDFNMNKEQVNQYVFSLAEVDAAEEKVFNMLKAMKESELEHFYHYLTYKHGVEGEKIYRDPVVTDVAMTVFTNIDAHGEIEAGKDEISAYSMSKALLVASAVKSGILRDLISSPDKINKLIESQIEVTFRMLSSLRRIVGEEINKVMEACDVLPSQRPKRKTNQDFSKLMSSLQDLDPANIVSRESDRLLNQAEKFAQKFQDETMEKMVELVLDPSTTTKQLVDYVLARKVELRKFFQDENSFYVCQIGAGNPFSGEAPGALKVVPGDRPIVNMNEIIGSGFDEVRQFVGNIKHLVKYHDLFVATSPSRKADKNNILLLGPQGSGKTEIMRAMASEKDSIAIYAQGSDFLTCWLGEAQKNPKRLFEAAIKLRKESGKHVHILIDEVDQVLNNDHHSGSVNLTLEFQMLMDGVVSYPGISVWGATNNPERIPMTMIRRFNKVLVVGKLTAGQRMQLLQHFVGFLPIDDSMDPNTWGRVATQLNGATGDVIRKVADHIWRSKITAFIDKSPEYADAMIKRLNEEARFDISEFTDEKRADFLQKLKEYVAVKPEDLLEATEIHLNNIAIKAEIQTAKKVYKNADKFMSGIDMKALPPKQKDSGDVN